MHQHTAQFITYAITAAVVALVLFLRLRGLRRATPLRLETLWIVPALLIVALGISIWEYPPPRAIGWLWLALALGAGALLGWRRGTLMRISVDPATHRLNQQASPAALLVIVVLLVARQGLRYEAAALGIDIYQATAILMASALGLIAATRLEMFFRARRLLA